MYILEIASVLPSHHDFLMSFTKFSSLFPRIVHEEVVDLVEVVRHFSSLRLDNFIQLLDTSSIIVGLATLFFNLCLHNQRDFALFVVPEES